LNTQSTALADEQNSKLDRFIYLIFGLQVHTNTESPEISNSLRRALNELAFEMRGDFPKTLHSFIGLCHEPIATWYPDPPQSFNAAFALLDNDKLSDEAQEFCFEISEQMQLPLSMEQDIPQTALDNLKIIHLRQRLKNHPDRQAAQNRYVQVRSFLIEHSWASPEQLRAQPDILSELREFYDGIDGLDDLVECTRCGLLEWNAGSWYGIKPSYCSDHGRGSPYTHTVKNTGQLWRLKRGIHLRTFLPGRIELALFELADNLQDEHPEHLISAERYPGFDTYDLRLTFSDSKVWALDAKDQAQPDKLAKQIQLLYGEGRLSYDHAFYVIPDRRMSEWSYRDTLESAVGSRPANLHIVSLSEFQQRIEEKLKNLTKPPRSKKGKRA
jgi:hypothetical protein